MLVGKLCFILNNISTKTNALQFFLKCNFLKDGYCVNFLALGICKIFSGKAKSPKYQETLTGRQVCLYCDPMKQIADQLRHRVSKAWSKMTNVCPEVREFPGVLMGAKYL